MNQQTKILDARTLGQAVLLGIVLTCGSLLCSRESCICGSDWGWPMPFREIICGTFDDPRYSYDAVALAVDLAFWSAVALALLFIRTFFIWRQARYPG